MKCKSYRCSIKPELEVSGWHKPHPEFYCPICRESYWVWEDNTIHNDPQTVKASGAKIWGAKSKDAFLSSGRYAWVRNFSN